MTQSSRGNRRGAVFSVRVSEDERTALERLQVARPGPRALGAWLIWSALQGDSPSVVPLQGSDDDGDITLGTTRSSMADAEKPLDRRRILDLCAGTGAWSEPYAAAGYDVVRVDLPDDVRTFVPPSDVWGVLAAPPCTEFSKAKNGHPRDLLAGMACVNACMRIVLQCRPRWWALENPIAGLSRFLGRPRDVFEPHEYGHPWTKTTALWGDFAIPRRGPFVDPTRGWSDDIGARTPSGFARAFCEANP